MITPKVGDYIMLVGMTSDTVKDLGLAKVIGIVSEPFPLVLTLLVKRPIYLASRTQF
jgi:hypothetical protein